MKVTRQVERTQTVTELTDILCNRCGRSCKQDPNFCGLLETKVSGCYGSPVLPDAATFQFSLCEHCLGRLFSEFLHAPHCVSVTFGRPPVGWRDGQPVYDAAPADPPEDEQP